MWAHAASRPLTHVDTTAGLARLQRAGRASRGLLGTPPATLSGGAFLAGTCTSCAAGAPGGLKRITVVLGGGLYDVSKGVDAVGLTSGGLLLRL
jgi:hypothetical protein